MATATDTPKLLTTREVAEELRVSLTTVYRLVSAGDLPVVMACPSAFAEIDDD